MLSAVRGSRAAPSPSIATVTPSASDATTSLWSAHARPSASNPGPRLADVAGTLTWTRTRLESRLRNHVNDGAAEPTGTHDRGRVDHAAGVRLPRCAWAPTGRAPSATPGWERIPHVMSSHRFADWEAAPGWVVQRAGGQHGDEDVEQAVHDATDGASMIMPAGAQTFVVRATDRIMAGGGLAPMVRRLDRPRCDRQRGRAQRGEDRVGVDTPDAMTAEDRADRGAGQVLRDARGRSTLEQGPEPGLVGRRHEVEELWVVAVQLLAQPIGEAAEFLLQVVFEARELPQLQEEGMLGFKPPEGREVGGKGGRQDLSVAPIVFGAGDREAINGSGRAAWD